MQDMSRETDSMRRARRWIAEMRQEAARSGRAVDAEDEALFAHLMTCSDCELRQNNDPDFCTLADAILDGPDDEDDQ